MSWIYSCNFGKFGLKFLATFKEPAKTVFDRKNRLVFLFSLSHYKDELDWDMQFPFIHTVQDKPLNLSFKSHQMKSGS